MCFETAAEEEEEEEQLYTSPSFVLMETVFYHRGLDT